MASAVEVRSRVLRIKKRAGIFAGAASLVVVVGIIGLGMLSHRSANENDRAGTPGTLIESKEGQSVQTPSGTTKITNIISQPSPAITPKTSGGNMTPSPTPPTATPAPQPNPVPIPEPNPVPIPTPDPAPDPPPPPPTPPDPEPIVPPPTQDDLNPAKPDQPQ